MEKHAQFLTHSHDGHTGASPADFEFFRSLKNTSLFGLKEGKEALLLPTDDLIGGYSKDGERLF